MTKKLELTLQIEQDITTSGNVFTEEQVQELQTTVVNIVVDMFETGESVDPTQLLKQFEDNKS